MRALRCRRGLAVAGLAALHEVRRGVLSIVSPGAGAFLGLAGLRLRAGVSAAPGRSDQIEKERRNHMRPVHLAFGAALALCALAPAARAESSRNVLIHVKTALSFDDAQICAAPNVALATLKAGHKVTMLFDASAVTSVTRGFGWRRKLSERSAMDRAGLPDRERRSLSEQLGVPLERVPHDYGEYLDFLKGQGVEIYGNKTMMLLYKIDPAKVESAVVPVGLERMVELFISADRVIVY